MVYFQSKITEKIVNRYGLIIVIALASFLSLWKLGQHPLQEWDESRYGMNALAMLEKGDLINYYFGDERETWNAKPPLSVWLIAIHYKIFGYNAFALRLHSAIAIILSFFFIYKICKLYYNPGFAFIVCMVLMGCKGLIGYHVGRTGDTDAILILSFLGCTYFFLKYIDKNSSNSIIIASIFLGLGFYSKGFAVILIFPALFLFLLLKKYLQKIFTNPKFWISVATFLLIVFSWIALLKTYGEEYNTHAKTGENNFHTFIIYDIVERFFSSDFGMEYDPWYFFDVSDSGFNIWNYVFYLILATFLLLIVKKELKVSHYFKKPANNLLLLSILISVTITLILTFSKNKCRWYLAPIYPFVAILIVKGMFFITKKHPLFKYIWISLIIFTLVRHFLYLNKIKPGVDQLFIKNYKEIVTHPQIMVYNNLNQVVYLHLKWLPTIIEISKDKQDVKNSIMNNELVFVSEKEFSALDIPRDSITCKCEYGYCLINL